MNRNKNTLAGTLTPAINELYGIKIDTAIKDKIASLDYITWQERKKGEMTLYICGVKKQLAILVGDNNIISAVIANTVTKTVIPLTVPQVWTLTRYQINKV